METIIQAVPKEALLDELTGKDMYVRQTTGIMRFTLLPIIIRPGDARNRALEGSYIQTCRWGNRKID